MGQLLLTSGSTCSPKRLTGARSGRAEFHTHCRAIMQQAEIPLRTLKFGVFEADLQTGELTKLGKRVRLQVQPFQLLAMLLEKPGVLVTREELHLKLWPQTT